MALASLAPGRPLQTLCLLLAGQPPAAILPAAAQPSAPCSALALLHAKSFLLATPRRA